MKTVYIGDIHGRINIVRYVDETFKNHRKVFVGDYVDAFDRTRAEQLECVRQVIAMVKRGDTIALMGNHDMGYLVPREMSATGYAHKMENMLHWNQLTGDMWKYFQYYLWDAENKILATHAGICKYVWQECGLTLENLEDKFFEWRRDPYYTGPLYWMGDYRGGVDRAGGPLWCDWNEEFAPVDGVIQIFGHTHLHKDEKHDKNEGIRQIGQNYNIDCLGHRAELLEFDDETKQFNKIVLDFLKS